MLDNLQAEHKEWVDREYPAQPPHIPAAGMVEEAGELLHAVLKLEQLSLWGSDGRYTMEGLHTKFVDSIGDCVLYACSFCNANKWEFSSFVELEYKKDTLLSMAVALVQIAANFSAVKPYVRSTMAMYMACVKSIAAVAGVDFNVAVLDTWANVKQRRRPIPPTVSYTV